MLNISSFRKKRNVSFNEYEDVTNNLALCTLLNVLQECNMRYTVDPSQQITCACIAVFMSPKKWEIPFLFSPLFAKVCLA